MSHAGAPLINEEDVVAIADALEAGQAHRDWLGVTVAGQTTLSAYRYWQTAAAHAETQDPWGDLSSVIYGDGLQSAEAPELYVAILLKASPVR